ncbi:DoxX family protein [uncultured Martelella sp.]|uniref:DoxX family protein n=1 Tax=uncultured Martelella sp. TaxID=392331 RepID=UPI0029C6624A|nr:DoxX family protein [uncultured Martelella sp.]
MKNIPWNHVLAGLLTAFFAVGGTLNLMASPATVEEYVHWGYPAWFPYVTGTLEWAAAVLIALPVVRLAGSALAGLVMTAAGITVLSNGEYAHVIPPAVILTLVCLNGWLTWRSRRKTI